MKIINIGILSGSTILISILLLFTVVKPDDSWTNVIIKVEKGGDCYKIGSWDAPSKTCTLNADIHNHSIKIESNGVQVNGNGNSIYGNGDESGIKILSQTGITITNLHIVNYYDGIFLQSSSNNTFTKLNITMNSRHGLFLKDGSDNNTISYNKIGPSNPAAFESYAAGHGIRIDDSNSNFISSNTITQTKDAIRLKNSNDNTITRNNFTDNHVEGIDMRSSERNIIFYNNIFESEATPIFNKHPELTNIFFIQSGGNYYSRFDEPAEGCFDLNFDYFCDDPYFFDGGEDLMPFIKPNGWEGKQ